MKRSIESIQHEAKPSKAVRLSIQSRLLALPRELRDRIYELALVSTVPISVLNFAEHQKHHLPKQEHGLSPALLSVNHQLYNEGVDVLYGLNTFQAEVRMQLHQALRRREVHQALEILRLPPDVELPEPEVICLTDRPQYNHPAISRIKRFEIRLAQVIPEQPHWHDGGVNVDHAMHDLCKAFVESGTLGLFILTTHGCASKDRWLAAAGQRLDFAGGIGDLMWWYHEWHFERALLAASAQDGVFWLNSREDCDRISEGGSVFHPCMRNASQGKGMKFPALRHLPPHMLRTGQLVHMEPLSNSWIA